MNHKGNGMMPLSFRKAVAPSRYARRKGQPPPEHTNAEHYYLLRLMNRKHKLTVIFKDGDALSGLLDWYDESTIKIACEDGRNLILPKQSIKYLFAVDDRKDRGTGK